MNEQEKRIMLDQFLDGWLAGSRDFSVELTNEETLPLEYILGWNHGKADFSRAFMDGINRFGLIDIVKQTCKKKLETTGNKNG